MADLVVIVPSRGRPERVRELAGVFYATVRADSKLIVAIDADDPVRDEYWALPFEFPALVLREQPSTNMGEALHMAATEVADDAFAVGFMGDDHLPRTVGWDQAYLDALHELGTGIVYGNDLLQGRELPTQCAMTSDIIRALGYMAPTSLVHLYFDNFWLSLGNKAGCIKYLPDVIVEHRHPLAGKAAIDDGYERVNSVAMHDRDEASYLAYLAVDFAADVEKVRALRGARV